MRTDIRRNAREWDIFVIIDGREEYLGSRQTRHDAEAVERDYRMNYFLDNHTPEHAAAVVREGWER